MSRAVLPRCFRHWALGNTAVILSMLRGAAFAFAPGKRAPVWSLPSSRFRQRAPASRVVRGTQRVQVSETVAAWPRTVSALPNPKDNPCRRLGALLQLRSQQCFHVPTGCRRCRRHRTVCAASSSSSSGGGGGGGKQVLLRAFAQCFPLSGLYCFAFRNLCNTRRRGLVIKRKNPTIDGLSFLCIVVIPFEQVWGYRRGSEKENGTI